MSEAETQTSISASTTFLSEGQQRDDESASRLVGPRLVTEMVRLLRTGELFGADHEQVRKGARELTDWLHECMQRFDEEFFSLQMTEANVFLDGQMLRFEESQYARSVTLRATFLTYSINQIKFDAGVGPGELVALLVELKAVRDGERDSLEGFSQPHLHLQMVGHRDLEALAESDIRREVIELYAGLVVKCATYFHQLQRTRGASARYIKRLVQKIADRFQDHRHVFIGLINLRLIRGQHFVHAVNTAMYAMFIAQEVGLDRRDLVRVGMTALTQDIHRLQRELRLEEQADIELGQASHFQTNMTSVTVLSEMGSTDLLSALRLVTGYERGFPYNRPLPPQWYREELRPHLLSRITELARHYDVLMQGIEGEQALPADMAMQAISEKMGSHYDPVLTRLFVNLVGVYPVGEVVLLSTGERALVVRSPTVAESSANRSVAHRPTVRLLDGSGRLLDLSADEHKGTKIVQILDEDAGDDPAQVEDPGAFFFF